MLVADRQSNGLTVHLNWNRIELTSPWNYSVDVFEVTVYDAHTDSHYKFPKVFSGKQALDIYYHPFARRSAKFEPVEVGHE